MGPEALAITSLASTAVGAGVSIIGAEQSASAKADADRYNAQVAANNAKINQDNAQRAAQAARQQGAAADMRAKAQEAATAAAFGASGIYTGSGSPLGVQRSEQQVDRLNTQTIVDNAMQQVRSYNVATMTDIAQQRQAEAAAANEQAAGNIAALSSFVGAAGQFSGNWLKFQMEGVPGFSSGPIKPTPVTGVG
jgi:hypothetical protein